MSSPRNLKIVFLTPYPHDTAPGQRFRFEQYLQRLEADGHKIQLFSFFTDKSFSILYAKGKTILKLCGIIKGFGRRLLHLFGIIRADYVFLFREATPIGPPIVEWIVARLLVKKVIYDFDDAIWLTDKINESRFEQVFRWRKKVASICMWSHKVSCGNQYLLEYAHRFNNGVVLNPTTVDTERVHNPALIREIIPKGNENTGKKYITIGWTGSHSTLKYLEWLAPVLNRLKKENSELKLLVIADVKPTLDVPFDFIPWDKESEAADLMHMDIGIMPLPNDEWTKGKCGFKALQYMAMEIPCVVSPVGVNTQIIEHGINGYLAHTETDWLLYLQALVTDLTLRKNIGKQGRDTVIKHYSVQSNVSNFLSLFE